MSSSTDAASGSSSNNNNSNNNNSTGHASNSVAKPSHTLYVWGLNERIRLDELKRGLYYIFAAFGNVLEVHARKTKVQRGRAWVVFDDVAASTRAKNGLMNFMLFGKPLLIDFAKNQSDVISKIQGTYKPRPKRKKTDSAPPAQHAGASKGASKGDGADGQTQQATNKKAKTTGDGVRAAAKAAEPVVPNKILFVQNLPDEANQLMMGMLFRQCPGYVEARIPPGKSGIAFVEFDNEFNAGQAMTAFQSYKVTDEHALEITYAKR